MDRYSLLGMAFACALTIYVPGSAQAASFTVDDFNVDTASSVTDDFIGGPVSAGSVIDGANIVMNGAVGWTRTLTADLTAGHSMDTVVCSNCQAGHVNMATGSSNGIATYTYSGPAVDLSAYSLLVFDWAADLAGADVGMVFSDGGNTATVASWSSLAATGGSGVGNLVTQAPMSIAWGAVNPSAITEIQLVVTGVDNMDASIDDFAAVVPVPAAAWLFGSALLGLVVIKRRKT